MAFRGAIVRLTSDILANATNNLFDWAEAVEDTKWQGLRFWLGPDAAFTVDIATNELIISSHGHVTSEGPVRVSSLGTVPAPLVPDTDYWVIRTSDDRIQLASTPNNARDGIAIDLTDAGQSTHTLERAARLVVPGTGIKKIQLFAATGIASGLASQMGARFVDTNGNLFRGSSTKGRFVGFGNVATSVFTPPLPATLSTAYSYEHMSNDASHDIESDTTYFGLQVVEAI